MSSDGCNIIEHYQKAIKKARNDETKLLHCIGKLDALPITIDHLQKTGVGKTINSLRKYNGEVGDAAKGLVAKWKTMVASGEVTSSSPEKQPNEYSSNFVAESDYSTKNHNEIKENETRLLSNGKIKEEKKHSDSQRDSNKVKDTHSHNHSHSHSKQTHHHHEGRKNSKSNDKEKSHKSSSSSKYAEKSSASSSKSSSSKSSSSKRHREEESAGKSHKRDSFTNEILESTASTSKANNETITDKHHSKAKKPKLIVNEGIDSSMGASFSDALGMCGISGSSKKNKKSQKLKESKLVLETSRFTKQDGAEKREKIKKQSPDLLPEALKTSPKTKLDLSLNLPLATSVKISDNYKPSPINQNVLNCVFPSSMPDKPTSAIYANLNISITSKTMRTKVYSGIKTGALLTVPSLFDICIRILQKNIDALEYTGGVPFDVLRPVLERTTPQQLLNFEDYNAYLLEDTDVLWKQHVGRHFRGMKREEGETWREMFLRCEHEKEQRLNILTKNIKISQKQSALPIKKTQLAYVDNPVKPPRNVQRKQELYGTNDKLIASPAARVAALSSGTHNTVVAGDPRLKIGRDLSISATNNPLKIKKAPLMAKTLQFIKKTYKR